MPFVFFYGTLMRSGDNHGVLEPLGARFVREASTAEARVLVDLGPYPALLGSGALEATSPVFGEIFEADAAALAALDDFEGVPHLYTRELASFVGADGERLEAFVYVFARSLPRRARVIPSGRYVGPGVALPGGAIPEQIDDD
jgi:gamma-glutamylcyclotransferase (GGCT)/AIG2-like uncharacterized protein YtfP